MSRNQGIEAGYGSEREVTNRQVYNTFINMASRSPTYSPETRNRLEFEMGINDDDMELDEANTDATEAIGEADKESFDQDELLYITGIKELESNGLVDIGNLASWEVSTFKPTCGVANLRDKSPMTYWQSDGQQPHYLTIKFTKFVEIERLCLFFNYSIDESYTPDRIVILAGTCDYDLIEVKSFDFFEPVGWQFIDFKNISSSNLLKCYLLKIKFVSNHQNGKDCHLRGVKIMSPSSLSTNFTNDNSNDCVEFTSRKFISESLIR